MSLILSDYSYDESSVMSTQLHHIENDNDDIDYTEDILNVSELV